MMTKPLTAELIGTFWLVFGGCGSAVLAAAFPDVGIGLLGVAFAFGLTLLTMAYAIGHISGCHLNPAVSIGLAVAGRFRSSQVLPYVVAQVLGGVLAALVLYAIATAVRDSRSRVDSTGPSGALPAPIPLRGDHGGSRPMASPSSRRETAELLDVEPLVSRHVTCPSRHTTDPALTQDALETGGECGASDVASGGIPPGWRRSLHMRPGHSSMRS